MIGAVVALTCIVGTNSAHFNVSLDESRGTMSYEVVETGKVFQNPAVFTPSVVIADSGYNLTKTIDRTTLTFVERYGNVPVRQGQCTIVDTPERKF